MALCPSGEGLQTQPSAAPHLVPRDLPQDPDSWKVLRALALESVGSWGLILSLQLASFVTLRVSPSFSVPPFP